MHETSPVSGYHGTSLTCAENIVKEGFHLSANDYDWLGKGVYFFQDAPYRAHEWAKENHKDNPCVIESKIELYDCLDFLDVKWYGMMRETYDKFLTMLKKSKKEIPKQSSLAHRIDRQVLDYVVGILSESGIKIRCIRAAFIEGKTISPQSALFDKAHIQISVRDISLIKSYSIWRNGGITND